MAPILLESDGDDDFVRTISDDDSKYPRHEEEEESTGEVPTKNTEKPKKRKRDLEDTAVATSNGTSKGSKKNKKRKADLEPGPPKSNTTAEGGDQTWTAQGEHDGAMDSEFEFQLGDGETGVTEDFDGWALDGGTTVPTVAGRKPKKGVDIDELIARMSKGAGKDATGGINGQQLVGEEDGDIGIEDEGDVDGGEDSDVEDNEEDETLAEDAFGMGLTAEDGEEDSDDAEDYQGPERASDNESIAEPVAHPDDVNAEESSVEELDDLEEIARRKAFFAPEDRKSKNRQTEASTDSFQYLSLSRPILRGLASVGFTSPTPIQTKTIPVALLGKDVVGGAVTGSGKTAAFIIPILERLLYRPRKVATSRVAILMPTRELAVQCFNVAKRLASFTDVTFCQLVGGFSLREQEKVLRSRPDIIIATPGRFIDHMRNSASFAVEMLEILVLDEADRMLEDGFADELNEILTTIPKSRQTMLFSATMTDRVDKLIRVGLNRPVRLMVDARKQTVGTLVQEFVRLRPGREDKRLGYLMYLCKSVYTERVIIFFRQKKEAHRTRVIFGVLGLRAAELHGDMSQEQRLAALTSFRNSTTTHLLATDVASRGLDIRNVDTVLNYTAPQSHEIYLHRVGRTARAGRTGRACTIAAEPDRKVVKQVVKSGRAQGAKIVSRVVDSGLADEMQDRVDALEGEVDDILKEEKEERLLNQSDMQLRKGENFIEHEDEIKSRPKRTWFESEKDKLVAKKKGEVELNGPRREGGKLSGKEKKRLDDGRERVEGRVWKKKRGDGEVGRGKGGEKTKGRERNGGRAKANGGKGGRGDKFEGGRKGKRK